MIGEARDHLALGLDVSSLDEAEALAERLAPWFSIAKIGLELYLSEGPRSVDRLHELGFRVFADLKLHDIPTTVERAARAVGRLGVAYLNVHAAGGVDMVKAGVAGLHEGAAEARHPRPTALAVTVLTSDADASAFPTRLDIARSGGCDGVVCSALEVAQVKELDPRFVTVVPGTRPAGSAHHDQARTATPEAAAAAGADVLVMARVVSQAPDPEAAAEAIAAEVTAGLAARSAALRGPG